jgi:hypothetical protein
MLAFLTQTRRVGARRKSTGSRPAADRNQSPVIRIAEIGRGGGIIARCARQARTSQSPADGGCILPEARRTCKHRARVSDDLEDPAMQASWPLARDGGGPSSKQAVPRGCKFIAKLESRGGRGLEPRASPRMPALDYYKKAWPRTTRYCSFIKTMGSS